MRFLTPRNVNNVSKSLLTNCGPFSMRRKAGVPYYTTHWSKKIDAKLGALVFHDGIARASVLYRSIMTTMNWFTVVFLQRTRNVHCNEFHGPTGGEKIHVVLTLETSSVYRAFTAVVECIVDLVGHMWPVVFSSHSIVHATPAGMSCRFQIMMQIEQVWSKRVWYPGLNSVVK